MNSTEIQRETQDTNAFAHVVLFCYSLRKFLPSGNFSFFLLVNKIILLSNSSLIQNENECVYVFSEFL